MPLTAEDAGTLAPQLEAAWARSDRLFLLLRPGALLEQPIPLRHPFLFYLGHLPAFAWNQLGRGALGAGPLRADFDELFARGIDPRDTSGAAGGSPWPDERSVLAYRDQARAEVRGVLERLPPEQLLRAHLVLEHELMHHETLLYMLQALDHGWKRVPGRATDATAAAQAPEPAPRRPVLVPAGEVRLGAERGALAFGWDNEFPEQRVDVPAFEVDDRPVTNAEFADFVRAGGYARRELWSDEAWEWLGSRGTEAPWGWSAAGAAWTVRAPFDDAPWERARHWPASVSIVEAKAFARWQGRRLLTEAEFRRAAEGEDERVARAAVLDFQRWSPEPVGSRPAARSRWGVGELIGNGWEWTASVFAPFPGFRADLPDYAGYSADFFDGRHRVLLGGSWATDRRLVRSSFRNWYQPHYPYPFTKFRTALSASPRSTPRPGS